MVEGLSVLNTNLLRENPSLLKTSKNYYATCVSLVRALPVGLTGNIFINSIAPMRVTGCPHPPILRKKWVPLFLQPLARKYKTARSNSLLVAPSKKFWTYSPLFASIWLSLKSWVVIWVKVIFTYIHGMCIESW